MPESYTRHCRTVFDRRALIDRVVHLMANASCSSPGFGTTEATAGLLGPSVTTPFPANPPLTHPPSRVRVERMFDNEPQTNTEEQPPSLAEIVREETDNGREIIRFLLDVMRNRFEDVKMCHRVQAAVQLAKLGSKEAEEFLKAASRSKNGRAPSRASGMSRQNDELADIIKSETSNGRDIVRFLVDVMHGNLDGFKPCHRIASAKELLRRGFDHTPADSGTDYGHDGVKQCKNDSCYHKKYAQERFMRDGADGEALRHIYGSEEAVSVARRAVLDHRQDTVLDHTHIPDRDFTPIDNPADDPYGKGCYGYNTLRLEFGDNQAIRAANKAVEEFKKRKAEHSEGESENEAPPVDRPSTTFPQQNGDSPSEEDDSLPPDHWSRPYPDRLRNHSTETDKSYKDPDPPSSVPPERPQNPPVGADFKPEREFEPAEHPNVILERSEEPPAPTPPPRKSSIKIFTGPPDEGPRLVRDPGGFQAAVDKVLSSGPL